MRRLLPALGLVGLLVVTACQPARLRPNVYGTGTPDSSHRNFPDPAVIQVGGTTYAFSTNSTGSGPVNIGVLASGDLRDWRAPGSSSRFAGEALPNKPAWARSRSNGGAFWGPSIVKLRGRFVLHFAAKHRNAPAGRPGWCVGTATSADPGGPYTAAAKPLFCRVSGKGRVAPLVRKPGKGKGSIDPQVFVAPNGKVFLHFKALDRPTQLWGVRLRADGRAVAGKAKGLVGRPAKARGAWEWSKRHRFTVLENPAMDRNGAAASLGYPYYLYYSGGEYRSTGYATGVAACRRPLGPCVLATSDRPWLRSRGKAKGPGGLSLFRKGGETWVAYHSWAKGSVGTNGRRLHLEPLSYEGLTPVLANRRPKGSFGAEAVVAGVTELSGTARDPDTGRPVTVVVREDGAEVARVQADEHGHWSVRLTSDPEEHRYCVRLRDDNGLSPREIGCRRVEAGVAAVP